MVAVTDALSVTCTVSRKLPELVGMPLISPVDELSVKPTGSEPVLTLNVYGGVPPAAARVSVYPTPIVPLGNAGAVVIVKPAAIVILNCLVAVTFLASLT